MRSHRKTISEKHYSYLPKTSNNSNVNQLMNGKTNVGLSALETKKPYEVADTLIRLSNNSWD